MTFIYYQVVLFNPNVIRTLANVTLRQLYDLTLQIQLNCSKIWFQVRFAPSCTTRLPNGYVMQCHGMATAISRHAAMVMKCEGETVWAKQVSTDNTAANQKWNVKCMLGRWVEGNNVREKKMSFMKNKLYEKV